MYLTGFFALATLVAIIGYLHKTHKYITLKSHLDSMTQRLKWEQDQNNETMKSLVDYIIFCGLAEKSFLISGPKTIKGDATVVDVISVHERNTDVSILIKRFESESNAEEDIDFAMRRASELIEILNTI